MCKGLATFSLQFDQFLKLLLIIHLYLFDVQITVKNKTLIFQTI